MLDSTLMKNESIDDHVDDHVDQEESKLAFLKKIRNASLYLLVLALAKLEV